MSYEVDRRQFLQLLAWSGLGMVVGCVPGTPGTTIPRTATSGAAADVWAVWEEARRAVRTSPDHLAARAALLVETGDHVALHAFVRDEIVTYPPYAHSFANAVTATRWGRRGVLRSGAGTPREKADLLAELLGEAGLAAEVVMAPATVTDGSALLRPVGVRPFLPDVDEATIERWLGVLGHDGPVDVAALDPDGVESLRLAESLLRLLPGAAVQQVFDGAVETLPVVRAVVGGRALVLDPTTPGTEPADEATRPVVAAPPSSPLPVLEVALQVASTFDPGTRTTVAAGSWPLDRLIGRRVVARFLPSGDPVAALQVPAIQVTTFTPILAVDGPDVAVEDAGTDAVYGDLVTVSGSVLTEDSAGGLMVDGEPVGVVPTESPVAKLAVEVNASAFPHVRLRVAAADAGGDPVLGVSGAAFSVTEDGVAVPFLLRQATPPPPRALLLLDGSSSLPSQFRDEGAVAFGTDLASRILAAHPHAEIRVAGINYGVASASPAWATNAAEVRSELERLITDGSEYWSALADARGLGANVVVLLTDARSTDPPDRVAMARPIVAVGPPVVAVGVGDVDLAALAEIAEVTGGASIQGTAPDQVVAAVLGYLADRDTQPIHIEYQALPQGPSERTVEVRTSKAAASGSYTVPAPSQRVAPPALSGIYLVIGLGGREVTRTLAGVPAEEAPSTSEVTQEVVDGVRAALFGVAMLSVEAAAPTHAAWLDDILTARLSLRPLVEAGPGLEGVVAALEAGIRHVPAELVTLHASLPVADGALTFETGPRIVLLARRPLFAGGLVTRADVLPFTRFATADRDPRSAFRTTLVRTARLAVAEAAVYDESTVDLLAGRPLGLLAQAAPAPRDGPQASHARLLDLWASDHRLVPDDEGDFAFWSIDPAGSLLGVLADGSGGGSSTDANAQCTAMNQGFAALDLVGWAGGMPFAFGGFLALQKAISKQALREAAIIASLGGEAPDTSACGDGIKDVPCDIAKDAVAQLAKPLEGLSVLEKMYTATTGKDVFNC